MCLIGLVVDVAAVGAVALAVVLAGIKVPIVLLLLLV